MCPVECYVDAWFNLLSILLVLSILKLLGFLHRVLYKNSELLFRISYFFNDRGLKGFPLCPFLNVKSMCELKHSLVTSKYLPIDLRSGLLFPNVIFNVWASEIELVNAYPTFPISASV